MDCNSLVIWPISKRAVLPITRPDIFCYEVMVKAGAVVITRRCAANQDCGPIDVAGHPGVYG